MSATLPGGSSVPFSTVPAGVGHGGVSWHRVFCSSPPPNALISPQETLKPKLLVLKLRCLGRRLGDDGCIYNHSVICPEEHRPPGNKLEVIVIAQLISSINTPHMLVVVINAEGYHHVLLLLLAECLSGLCIGALLPRPLPSSFFFRPYFIHEQCLGW